MTIWYNAPSNGSEFAKLGSLVDSESVNSRIDFSEGIFRVDRERQLIECFLYAESVTDVKKSQEQGWIYSPQAIAFNLYNCDYEKSQGRDKPPKKMSPLPFSKWLYKRILEETESSDTPNTFLAKGFIHFSEPIGSANATQILSGVDTKGNPLSDARIEIYEESCFCLQAIASTDLSKLDLSKLPSGDGKKGGYGGYGGKPAQTELQRLDDRWKHINKILQIESDASFVETYATIKALSADDKDLISMLRFLESTLG
jgi:hypothetical protein